MRLFLSCLTTSLLLTTASTALAEPTCGTPCVTSETSTKMRSVPVFVTGVFFDTVGAAAMAAGTGIVVASRDCGPSVSCSVSGTVVDLVGIAAMAGGAIFLAIGIPLTVVGGKSVPDVPSHTGAARGLTWTF